MKFHYSEGMGGAHTLYVQTDDLFIVCVDFFKGEAEEFRFSGDQTFTANEAEVSLRVCVDGQIVKISEIIEEAERQYPDIIAEVEQEQDDEEAHEREMSSLEATGLRLCLSFLKVLC